MGQDTYAEPKWTPGVVKPQEIAVKHQVVVGGYKMFTQIGETARGHGG